MFKRVPSLFRFTQENSQVSSFTSESTGRGGLSKLGRDSNFIFKQHVKLLVVSFSIGTAKKKREIDAQFFPFVAAVMF